GGSGRRGRGGLLRSELARARLGRFGSLALGALLLLALAPLRCELLFLATERLGLGVRLFLAAKQIFLARMRGGGVLGGRGDVVALDEGALLAHLDLDRARLAARVGLLDLAGRLANEGDLLALAGRGGAVCRAQMVEQARLVALGQRVVGGGLAHAGRPQLLEQRRRGAVELGGELGDGGRCHRGAYPWVVVSCDVSASAVALAAFSCAAASAANQCSRAFMISVFAASASISVSSTSSSTARSARSSRVCTPPASSLAISSGVRPSRSRRSCETSPLCSSRAMSIVSSASLARVRSSLTVSSSKLAISSISCIGT